MIRLPLHKRSKENVDTKIRDLATQILTLPTHSPLCLIARSNNLTQLSNDKRYYFSHPNQANWTVANSTCTEMGLHLASLKNQVDLSIVWHELKRFTNENHIWWVSAKDFSTVDRHHDFQWFDGTKIDINSELWSPKDKGRSGCVRLVYGNNTSWTDKLYRGSCSEHWGVYICELPSECY
ncbi:uncharacterized protein LOC132200542 isoform X2 [Neocloeon triangulifer]|uniref:uncharacterized protein LOC132200542 isoform X2 n=1 Tax=Neocloeon triangulifer TaxID=2078957 RepID=UPI00286EC5D3|nr:uncharacterized protein LOC132200542 isoform X2 [Neocloeon triangulifer]